VSSFNQYRYDGKKEMLDVRRLATVLLLLLTLGSRALGDSAPLASVGPGVEPMDSTSVRMAEERIEINLSRNLSHLPYCHWDAVGEYRIWFRFEPEVDEEMLVGFPLFIIDPEQSIYGGQVQDLRVEVDGQEVAVEVRPSAYGKQNGNAHPANWAVYPVSFRAGQPLEMVVSYRMPVSPFGKSPNAPLWVSYVLRTGAYWAGSIGRAEAVVTMDRPVRTEDIHTRADYWRSTTPGWTLEDGVLRWVWEDVEPDFDLHVVLENPYWLDMYGDLRAMLDEGLADPDALTHVLQCTGALFAPGRVGGVSPLRDGVMSDEAAEELLPDLLAAARVYLADHPEDTTVREAYLELLADSIVVTGYEGSAWVVRVRSEERLVYTLAELTRLARQGDLHGRLPNWRPWTYPGLTDHPWQAETQEAIASFLAVVMPTSFGSPAEVEKWVTTNAGNALSADQVSALRTQAMERIRPAAPADEAAGRATASGGAAGQATVSGTATDEAAAQGTAADETTAGETPAAPAVMGGADDADESGGHIGVALLIVGLCLTLGAAGTAGLWAWRSARRRARQSARRTEPTDPS